MLWRNCMKNWGIKEFKNLQMCSDENLVASIEEEV